VRDTSDKVIKSVEEIRQFYFRQRLLSKNLEMKVNSYDVQRVKNKVMIRFLAIEASYTKKSQGSHNMKNFIN
jgi:hypothetical protein